MIRSVFVFSGGFPRGDGGESSSSSDLKADAFNPSALLAASSLRCFFLKAELTRCRERAQCAADTAERVISDKRPFRLLSFLLLWVLHQK